jgi:hypothetical protein
MVKTLATFRIEEEDWKAFQEWAKSKGSNATSEVVAYVSLTLGKTDKRIGGNALDEMIDSRLDSLIDSKLEARLKDIQALNESKKDDRIVALIEKRLEKLEAEGEEIKKK